MSFRVFQVDDSDFLTPYTFESETLGAAGIELVEGFCETPEHVIERGADADVLWLSWKPPIDAAILTALPKCRLVIRWGIGYDQIDLTAATERGVAVANAPTYGTDDVAEHALALLMALERQLIPFDSDMRSGGWKSPVAGSIRRITGATLGLVGVGRIGQALARRARGIGLEVIGHEPYRGADELTALGIEAVELTEVARRSDYVSVHVPHTPDTHALIDAAFLAQMKPDAYLINTARGKVVNERDLLVALGDGSIAGAALDVFWDEPLAADSPLRSLPNVILTPHYAGYSAQAWVDLRAEMCRTTIDFLTTGWAEAIVNPEVRGRLRPLPAPM